MIDSRRSISGFRKILTGSKRLFLSLEVLFLFSGLFVHAVDEFKFHRNDQYDIEYLSGENKAVVISDVYYRDEWWMVPSLKEETDYSDTKRLMERRMRFLEFLKVYEDGKREVHLIRLDTIIRITQVIKDSSKARRSSSSLSKTASDEDLKIRFSE